MTPAARTSMRTSVAANGASASGLSIRASPSSVPSLPGSRPRRQRLSGDQLTALPQPRRQRLPLAQGELGLGACERRREDLLGCIRAVAVDHDDAPGVLGRRGGGQSAKRGLGGVGGLLGAHGEGAVGEDRQAALLLIACEEVLELCEQGEGGLFGARALGGAPGLRLGPLLCVLAGARRRLPAQCVERVGPAAGDGQRARVEGPRGELPDQPQGSAEAVEELDPGLLALDADAHPQLRLGEGGERGAREGEGQAHLPRRPGGGVKGRVEQGGMDREAGGGELCGQRGLGVDVGAVLPGGVEPLEGLAVVEARLGQARPEVIDLDLLASRRPLAEGRRRGGLGLGEGSRRVPDPLRRLLFGAGVDRELSRPFPGSREGDPQRHRGLGEQERCLQGELLDRGGPCLLAGVEGGVEEGGAGQQRGLADGVVGEPGVLGEGDAAAELQALSLGVLDRGAEEGVVERPLADGAGVCLALRVEPVALSLEGVGGKGDRLCAGALEEGLPIDLGSCGVGGGEGADGAAGLGVAEAKRRGEGELAVLPEALLCHRAEHGVGAELQGGGGALLQQGRDRVGEAHRPADVGDPVGGVGRLLGTEQLAADVGDDRDLGSLEGEALADRGEGLQHRLHQRRVEGVGDVQALGLPALLLPGRLALLDRLGEAGEDAGARRVDRGEGELCLPALDQLQGLLLAGLDRQHRPAGGQGPHQGAAGADEPGGVGEGEDAGEVGGRYLPHGVPGHRLRCEAPAPVEAAEGDLGGEEGGLGEVVWASSAASRDPSSAKTSSARERSISGSIASQASSKASAIGGVGLIELPAHARSLGALAGEEEGELDVLVRRSGEGGVGRRSPRPSAPSPSSSSCSSAATTTALLGSWALVVARE